MKFKYVQIGAKDYKALADFYINALDFVKVDDDSWLDGKEGIVLQAPGFDDGNAVLFGFIPSTKGASAQINDKGFAHTCYETTDVKGAVKRLVKFGGGFQSTLKHPTINPCVYCKDPEGNVVEFHVPFPSPDAKIGVTVASLLGLKPDKAIRKGKGKSGMKFIHVNLITDDWTALCDYYKTVFGATDFGNLKDHSGGYKEKVIGVAGVHVIGHHILLPDYKASYPTLEIFTYSIQGRKEVCDETALGINAIGFECTDLEKDLESIVNAGGKFFEKTNTLTIAGDLQGGRLLLK